MLPSGLQGRRMHPRCGVVRGPLKANRLGHVRARDVAGETIARPVCTMPGYPDVWGLTADIPTHSYLVNYTPTGGAWCFAFR